MNLDNIREVITKELVKKYTKGKITDKQVFYLRSCIESNIYNQVTSRLKAIVDQIYTENLKNITESAASLIADKNDYTINDRINKILFYKKNKTKGILDKNTGIVTLFAINNRSIGIDNYVKDEYGYDRTIDARTYLINNSINIKIANELEDIAEDITKQYCEYFLECRDFNKLKEPLIDFILPAKLVTGSTGTVMIKKRGVKKKTEKKYFLNKSKYIITDEIKKIREEYANNKTDVIEYLTIFAPKIDNIKRKKEFCKRYGFTEETLNELYYITEEEVQKLIKKQGVKSFTPQLNNCLIIPFFNEDGVIVGYIGRVDTEINTNAVGKYTMIRSPWNCEKKELEDTFHAGLFLYNLNKVASKLKKGEEVNKIIIVEGALKAKLIEQCCKDTNVMATCTCNISDTQIALLRKYLKDDVEIVMAYDNDLAGKQANIKNAFKLYEAGFTNISFLNKESNYKGCKDENDYVDMYIQAGYTLDDALEEFKKMFYRVVKNPMQIQFPTLKQLDMLLTSGYSVSEIINLYNGSDIRVNLQSNTVFRRCMDEVVNTNDKLNIQSIDDLIEKYKKGYCQAMQIEIACLQKNKWKKEWNIISFEITKEEKDQLKIEMEKERNWNIHYLKMNKVINNDQCLGEEYQQYDTTSEVELYKVYLQFIHEKRIKGYKFTFEDYKETLKNFNDGDMEMPF